MTKRFAGLIYYSVLIAFYYYITDFLDDFIDSKGLERSSLNRAQLSSLREAMKNGEDTATVFIRATHLFDDTETFWCFVETYTDRKRIRRSSGDDGELSLEPSNEQVHSSLISLNLKPYIKAFYCTIG